MNEEQIIPRCVGFIMDGNRRFALERGEGSFSGHEAGLKNFFNVCQWVQEKKITHAVFYAFSTENWKRGKVEVEGLMRLFLQMTEEMLKKLATDKEKLRVRFIGQREDLSPKLLQAVEKLEQATMHYGDITTIWVALSYGGRAEIVSAANQAVAKGEKVSEETFAQLLWSAELPGIDLIIRTGGDTRLSNFMTWHSVYSELVFSDTYWPAFTKDEFERILSLYGTKDRRYGK